MLFFILWMAAPASFNPEVFSTAEIMAGVIFNVIYYYTRSIAKCILSYAIANPCLAAYVLRTGSWNFWQPSPDNQTNGANH